jgi:phage/plasmid primase-like uncharacterized protein
VSGRTTWLRVNRERPCPVCKKCDWCLVAEDGSACICPRTVSPRRGGDAGYLHRLTDAPRRHEPRRVVFPARAGAPNLSELAAGYRAAATAEQLAALAAELGVSTAGLNAYRVGWAAGYRAWSFPMTDPTSGRVTGVRLRPPTGKKFSVRGGTESLFLPAVPAAAAGEVLLITEGATDAIAAYTIGFSNAVGRPSCTGGTAHLVALVRSRRPARVVVVADNDEPGARGAGALASALALHARDVRVIAPPDEMKDLRMWAAAGATRADLEQLIHAAPARRLDITLATKEPT